jgi:uncharacterized protein YqgC (DUF456 family)
MKNSISIPVFNGLILPIILGLVIALIAYANLSNRSLPFISNPKQALVAILIIGMTMCALGGIGQVGASGKWASPLAIIGYILGTGLLVVIIGGLAGWKIPYATNPHDAVNAASLLILGKFIIGTLSFFFHLL